MYYEKDTHENIIDDLQFNNDIDKYRPCQSPPKIKYNIIKYKKNHIRFLSISLFSFIFLIIRYKFIILTHNFK